MNLPPICWIVTVQWERDPWGWDDDTSLLMMYEGVYQAWLKGRILGSIREKRAYTGYLFPITRLTQGCGRSFQKLATRVCFSVYRNSYFWLWFNWHQAARVISFSRHVFHGLWRPPFLPAQTSGYPTQGWNTWESSKQYEKISIAELLVVPYAKSVLVVASIHIYRIYCIPFCMCAGLHMRSQIGTTHSWVSWCTLASTFAFCWLVVSLCGTCFSTSSQEYVQHQAVIQHLTNIHWISTVVDMTFGALQTLAEFIIFLYFGFFFKISMLNQDLSATLQPPGVISIPTATWTPWRWVFRVKPFCWCWLVVGLPLESPIIHREFA